MKIVFGKQVDPGASSGIKASSYPDPDSIREKADPQHQSGLLSRLPPNVRNLIYLEIWRTAGLSQHICGSFHDESAFTHWPCVVDHEADDERQQPGGSGKEDVDIADLLQGDTVDPQAEPLNGPDFIFDPQWYSKLMSNWANHWKCEAHRRGVYSQELFDGVPVGTYRPYSPFLPMMLTCRQMYLECVESIYENITFVAHPGPASTHFLDVDKAPKHPVGRRIRHLQVSVMAFHTSLQVDGAVAFLRPGKACYEWTKLAKLSNLQTLSIWLDVLHSDLSLVHPQAVHWEEADVKRCLVTRCGDLRVTISCALDAASFTGNQSPEEERWFTRNRRGESRFQPLGRAGYIKDRHSPNGQQSFVEYIYPFVRYRRTPKLNVQGRVRECLSVLAQQIKGHLG